MKSKKSRAVAALCVAVLCIAGAIACAYYLHNDKQIVSVMENVYFSEDDNELQLVTKDNVDAEISVEWIEKTPDDLLSAVKEYGESLNAWAFKLNFNTKQDITDKDSYIIIRAPRGYGVGMFGYVCGFDNGELIRFDQQYCDFFGYIQFVKIPYSDVVKYDTMCFVQHQHANQPVNQGGGTVED